MENKKQVQHPFFTVYVYKTNIPRRKITNLTEAVTEALRLSKKMNVSAFVVEYDGMPTVICRCTNDGKIEQV